MRRIHLAAAVLLLASPAFADAIDGDWCAPEGGKNLSIEGPSIRTPGGTRMTGQYSRHAFSYVAPAGDPNAGTAVDMTLMGETRVRVQERGGSDAIWRRCPPGIS